jgi:uncharacterized protein YndB with AHSA1/START domain
MSHYAKHLVLDATPAAVYAALTTPEGLRGWWSEDSDIAPAEVGGTHTFRFGRTHKDFLVERLDTDREVSWRCTVAHIAAAHLARPDEWVGTEISFRLAPIGSGRTSLDFEHVGLEPALACWDVCREGWDWYLESLRGLVETGRGTPHLRDAACVA